MERKDEKKRSRTQNWTIEEKIALIDHIQTNISVIENKKKMVFSNKNREDCWKHIQQGMQSEGFGLRDIGRIKEQWLRMKTQAKKRISDFKKIGKQTGGGPPVQAPWEYDYVIKSLIPHEFEEAVSIYDSENTVLQDDAHSVDTTIFKQTENTLNVLPEFYDEVIKPNNSNPTIDSLENATSYLSNSGSGDEQFSQEISNHNSNNKRSELTSDKNGKKKMNRQKNKNNSRVGVMRKISEYEHLMYKLNEKRINLAIDHSKEIHVLQKNKIEEEIKQNNQLFLLKKQQEEILFKEKLKTFNIVN